MINVRIMSCIKYEMESMKYDKSIKCKRNIDFNEVEDSGYNSDEQYSLSKSNLKSIADVSKSLSELPTPNISWKYRLRLASTPVVLSTTEIKPPELSNFSHIEGPLLRSKTFPNDSLSNLPKLNLSLEDFSSVKKSRLKISESFKCKREKKSSLERSPFKTPSKSSKKKLQSLEDVTGPDNVFADPEVKARTVKALFCCAKSVSPISSPCRRVSPRFSSILTRIMENSAYLLPKIFSYLSNQDLIYVSQVCHQFRAIVHDTNRLTVRKHLYLNNVKKKIKEVGKENAVASVTPSPAYYTRSTPRKHLQELQKYSPLRSTMNSPVKPLSRFERFVKEGKNLLAGEVQRKCVQCQYPSHVTESESRGRCTNERCGYVYCTRCLLPYHPSSQCLSLKPKPKISAVKFLSKACKKRLRRL